MATEGATARIRPDGGLCGWGGGSGRVAPSAPDGEELNRPGFPGVVQFLAVQGIEAVIPPKANRTEAIQFFNKLKQFRRIATRYDKLSRTFLAFIHIMSAWIMLR